MKPKFITYYNRMYTIDYKNKLAFSPKAISSAYSIYKKMEKSGKFKKLSVFKRIAKFFDKPKVIRVEKNTDFSHPMDPIINAEDKTE